MVSYREIEERLNTQTDSVCSGYPERGPFDSEQEAWSAEIPPGAAVVKVHPDARGWWAIFTGTTTTTTLKPPPEDFEEYAKTHLSPAGREIVR